MASLDRVASASVPTTCDTSCRWFRARECDANMLQSDRVASAAWEERGTTGSCSGGWVANTLPNCRTARPESIPAWLNHLRPFGPPLVHPLWSRSYANLTNLRVRFTYERLIWIPFFLFLFEPRSQFFHAASSRMVSPDSRLCKPISAAIERPRIRRSILPKVYLRGRFADDFQSDIATTTLRFDGRHKLSPLVDFRSDA